MAENQTRPTQASVATYFKAIENEERRRDCEALAALMADTTGLPAVMWGPAIVGFGSYHYKYDSGREGDSCLVGFASRKGDISLYLAGAFPGHDELLARLGKHKMAKACLYVRRLADVDLQVLAQLVAGSVAEMKRRHG